MKGKPKLVDVNVLYKMKSKIDKRVLQNNRYVDSFKFNLFIIILLLLGLLFLYYKYYNKNNSNNSNNSN